MTKKTALESPPKIVYAGDRDISVWVLKFILKQGIKPVALMIPKEDKATHAHLLIKLCKHLNSSRILKGDQFRSKNGISLLKKLEPDYIIGVHFPYIVPKEVLEIPKYGVLNLHPAYLPYNRGWHNPTWAIWEETPYGATLHFMDEGVDTGDIIHQERIEILPSDTADTLYKRVKKLELEVFKEAWPSLVSGTCGRKSQPAEKGSFHKKADISFIQYIDLNKRVKAGDLIRRLRALTTNNAKEGAYFKIGGKLCRVQLRIVEENEGT